MLSKSKLLPRLVLSALTLPLAAFSSTAISVNGTCSYGDCTAGALSTGALTLGSSSAGSYSFGITLGDGDSYNIAGSYMNTFYAGTFLGFYPTVTYTGVAKTTAVDTISLDMLQDFFFAGTNVDWSGNYNEIIPLSLPVSGSSATGNVKYDGQTVGVLGPVFGTGMYTLTATNNLANLTGNTLVSDYNLTFTFPVGTMPNSIASSPTPEPMQTIPVALGLLGLFALKARKSRNGARS